MFQLDTYCSLEGLHNGLKRGETTGERALENVAERSLFIEKM